MWYTFISQKHHRARSFINEEPALAAIMDPDTINILKVVAYLAIGTLGLALLGGWTLRRFGSPRE